MIAEELSKFQRDLDRKFPDLYIDFLHPQEVDGDSGYYDYTGNAGEADLTGEYTLSIVINLTIQTRDKDKVADYHDRMIRIPQCAGFSVATVEDANTPVYIVQASYDRNIVL